MLELMALPFAFAGRFLRFMADREALVAENLFLCRQLGLLIEEKVRPRRASDGTRLMMVMVIPELLTYPRF